MKVNALFGEVNARLLKQTGRVEWFHRNSFPPKQLHPQHQESDLIVATYALFNGLLGTEVGQGRPIHIRIKCWTKGHSANLLNLHRQFLFSQSSSAALSRKHICVSCDNSLLANSHSSQQYGSEIVLETRINTKCGFPNISSYAPAPFSLCGCN